MKEDRRGVVFGPAFFVMLAVFIVLILVVTVVYILGFVEFGDIPAPDYKNVVGFETVFNHGNWEFFNFIFGKIPNYLTEWTSGISAGIIIIGLWFMLFLTFSDVLSVFSFFNQWISWIIGLLLAIVAANLKIISYVIVGALAVTAGLGAIAIFVALTGAFVMFVVFNFGTHALRDRMILRKAQDRGIRAVAGARDAAAGIRAAKEIAKAAREGV